MVSMSAGLISAMRLTPLSWFEAAERAASGRARHGVQAVFNHGVGDRDAVYNVQRLRIAEDRGHAAHAHLEAATRGA